MSGRHRHALTRATGGVFALALWIALTDSVKLQELAAGVVVAIAVTALLVLIEPFDDGGEEPAGAALSPRALLRPPLRLVAEMPLLVRLLWRRVRHGEAIAGSLRSDPVEGGPLLSEWWGSLTPSRYAVGVTDDRERVLVHVLSEPGSGSGR